MPIFRGPSGDAPHEDDELSTRKVNQNLNDSFLDSSMEPDKPSVPMIDTDEAETRVVYRNPPNDETKLVVKTSDAMPNLVVGWLVIIKGPGKGHILQLDYGMNSIGRSQTESICLDFGDEKISRTQHAIVTYDPRGRKFYVQHGGGKNLSYLGEKPLLIPTELHGGEEILLGQTTLRFVPLCGENFDWQDNS